MEASCCTAKPPLPSLISLLSRCCPDVCQTVKKGKIVLCCVASSYFKRKKQDRLCLLAMPFQPLTQPRACHCQGHTLPPCCLSLQAKDSLWLRKFSQQCDEVKICPGRSYRWMYAKKSAKVAKNDLRHYQAILSTAFFCPSQKQQQDWSSKQLSGLPWTLRSPATQGICRVGFRALDSGPMY